MARTVNQIAQQIKADFVSNATLREAYGLDLTKSFDAQFSSVSVEAALIYIISLAHYIIEKIMDSFRDEVDARISNAQLCSIPWYKQKALEYQHGYDLQFNAKNYTWGYATIEDSAKIVKYVDVREVEDTVTKLRVYINKAGKVPLSDLEITPFQAYMKKIGAAGTHYEFINKNPDRLKITAQIIFNPLVLDASGMHLSKGSYPVRDAINAYTVDRPFGGNFNRTKLVDAMQSAEGVVDVILTEIQHAPYGEAFEVIDGQNIDSTSGSFVIDTLTDTYTPSV